MIKKKAQISEIPYIIRIIIIIVIVIGGMYLIRNQFSSFLDWLKQIFRFGM